MWLALVSDFEKGSFCLSIGSTINYNSVPDTPNQLGSRCDADVRLYVLSLFLLRGMVLSCHQTRSGGKIYCRRAIFAEFQYPRIYYIRNRSCIPLSNAKHIQFY